jgi:hypothetical protein
MHTKAPNGRALPPTQAAKKAQAPAPHDVIDELTWLVWAWFHTAEPEERTQQNLFRLIEKWSTNI